MIKVSSPIYYKYVEIEKEMSSFSQFNIIAPFLQIVMYKKQKMPSFWAFLINCNKKLGLFFCIFGMIFDILHQQRHLTLEQDGDTLDHYFNFFIALNAAGGYPTH